ncbi:MAG: phage tail protein [Chitinophagaceae bacterium]|nr:phage tail protein [Chitinophagaceae bacterium]
MIRENIRATGSVFLQVRDAVTGKLIEQSLEKNLVVNLGKTNVAKLLGGDAAGKAITKIAVGEGTAAPTTGDTNLTNKFTKAIGSVAYPTANSVQFNFEIGTTEANGLNITELGLFNDSGVLFSRKVRAAIAKTSAVVITGIWTININ